jgi:UDP-N-acetylglucosamine 2-epimerase
MKVMTLVGTRPELIKLSRVIAELDKHMDNVLVHTGQNYDYELNQIFFDDLEIRKPDYFLSAVGSTTAETIGNVIAKVDGVIEKEKPDALLLYGDTNSCLGVIAAKRRKVPVFHMEAGNRCFDQRVPEELNRIVVDHLSDINLVLTEHARRYLLREGVAPETIFKIGSSMREVLTHYREKIAASQILNKLGLRDNQYFVLSAHREENVDSLQNLIALLDSMNAIAEKFRRRIIVSTHPRIRQRLGGVQGKGVHELVEFHAPFGFCDYIALQLNSACVISDSGTITEESSLLGFPAVMIRQAHERPEGMDEGTAVMCGLEGERVVSAIEMVLLQRESFSSPPEVISDYKVDFVSRKVVRLILSYTDYVNRTVWKKVPDSHSF